MSEFIVGQWVECVNDHCTNLLKKGEFYRVGQDPHYNGCGVYIEEVKALFGSGIFRPVEWKVGRTYKTTLEGVTATITSVEGHVIRGVVSGHAVGGVWDADGTGRCGGCELGSKAVPHLTPYLADEPTPEVEASEPAANNRDITSEVNGDADPINPPHYQQHPSGVEAITITEHFGFNVGNAIKYLWRAGLKGDALTDLRKAKWYVEREIQRVEKMKGGAE